MLTRFGSYSYIFATIALTVYGQIVLKWRIRDAGLLPDEILPKLKFLLFLLFDPYILSGFFAAFLAALTWMAALTKFELNHAYPFMSLNFVIVLILGVWLLGEPISVARVAGIALIVAGTLVAANG